MDFEDILKGIVSSTDNSCLKLEETCKQVDILVEKMEVGIQKIPTLTKVIEAKMTKLENEQNKILIQTSIEIEKLELNQKNANDYLNSLHKEYEKQKQIHLDLQKQLELSPHDEKILTLARQNLSCIKKLQVLYGIIQYPLNLQLQDMPETRTKVKYTPSNQSKLTHEEIVDNMWTKIANSSEAWTDIIDMCSTENKENIQTNNE